MFKRGCGLWCLMPLSTTCLKGVQLYGIVLFIQHQCKKSWMIVDYFFRCAYTHVYIYIYIIYMFFCFLFSEFKNYYCPFYSPDNQSLFKDLHEIKYKYLLYTLRE